VLVERQGAVLADRVPDVVPRVAAGSRRLERDRRGDDVAPVPEHPDHVARRDADVGVEEQQVPGAAARVERREHRVARPRGVALAARGDVRQRDAGAREADERRDVVDVHEPARRERRDHQAGGVDRHAGGRYLSRRPRV